MFPKTTTILLVDDMTTMRKLVKRSLTDLKYTDVKEAKDGLEAWELLEANSFGLIISDWNMPNYTGLELLKKVRSNPSMADMPFILLIAESEKSQKSEAYNAGVNGWLAKPFTTENLEDKLKEVWLSIKYKAA